MKQVGETVPQVTFKYRVRTDGHDICFVNKENGGENPFDWKDVTTDDIFKGKRVVVFSLPGAFTPTCSTSQVPGFEETYQEMKDLGVDEVYVISVNDTFVMRKWMIDQGVKNIKFIPDGTGQFTGEMGALVCKDNLGFGMRSWRYAMVVDNGVIEFMSAEEGMDDNCPTDPYVESTPEKIIEHLVLSTVPH
jgi:thioredoxin-dependent peroxiredoxin